MSEQHTIDIVCPSGLSLRVRGLGGAEFDLYENKDVIQNRQLKNQLLDQCTIEVLHVPSFYDKTKVLNAAGKIVWDEILRSDRFYTVFEIRKAGDEKEGHLYEAKFHCDNPNCGEHYPRTVDLNKLKVIELSDEAKDSLGRNVNEFEHELDDGDIVVTKLIFGRDEATIERNRKLDKEQRATTAMVINIVRVETASGATLDDVVDIRRWIRGLSSQKWFDVWECIEDHDGGIDTNFVTMCPECSNPFDDDFEIGSNFLNPQNKKRRDKRRAKRLARARK